MSGCGHDHSHGHGHGHGLGGHDHAAGASERAVLIAAVLTGAFMLAEVAGGLISGSLALLADAGHMLTDFVGLALAFVAFRLARRPADWSRSYGYDRFQILVAFVNGLSLIAIAAWIVREAVERIAAPAPILAGTMLWVAVGGLVVNVVAFWVLTRDASENLNLRAASLHVLGDMLGSVGAIAAALLIMATGMTLFDPILSVLVALLVLRAAIRVVRESAHILLEGTPAAIDEGAVEADLETLPGIEDVHHVHCWSLTGERRLATLHARIADGVDADGARRAIKDRLRFAHGIGHATVEIEHVACVGGDCGEGHAHRVNRHEGEPA